MAGMLPPARRAEGISYWGLSSVLALALAPPIGFWVYRFGWLWLCLFAALLNIVMAPSSWQLWGPRPPRGRATERDPRGWVEWVCSSCRCRFSSTATRAPVITSFSAMFADSLGITPKTVYLHRRLPS